MKRLTISILFLLTIIFSLYSETIKVGYVNYHGYQEGLENEYKTGFGYEYLQKLSYYTGWEFQYVYGSFSELLDKISNNEIDIMGNVSYTEERANKMSFSAVEQGLETFYFYVLSENANLVKLDLSILNGKRVGVNAGSYQKTLFEEWCKNNDIDCTIVEYQDDEKRGKDLNSSYLFGIIESNIVGRTELSQNWISTFNVGSAPFYFAVSKSRPDILKQLNQAQDKILSSNRFYNDEVKIKYLRGQEINSHELTDLEHNWLLEHPLIKIGYLVDYAPFCNTLNENGELTGLISSVLDYIEKEFTVAFQPITFHDYEDLIFALNSNQIDIAFPILGDFWVAEMAKIALTDSFTTSNMLLFYKGEYNKHLTEKIAVTKSSPFSENYAKILYPNAELFYYDTIWDCIDAANADETLSTIFNASCFHVDKNIYDVFDSFQISLLNDSIDICFAVKKGDTELLSFLNKGLSSIPRSLINDSLVEFSFVEEQISLKKILKSHPKTVFFAGLGFFMLILLFFIGYIVIIRKNNKKLIVLREQAEFANAAKTTFLFNMSHDIRTPMNAVVGFTKMAQQNLTNPEKLEDYLKKIKISSDTLLDLINQVLDLARIESNKIQVNYDVESLYKFDEVMRSMFETAAAANDIKLILETDIQDEYYYVDQSMMTQICVNLMGNALKFTPCGGTIIHSLKQVSKPDIFGMVKIELTIKDTGIGMSEDYLKKAFEAFSRERTSTESGIQGTGLGLSIVKRTCDLLGATLDVKSEVGKGTEFKIGYSLKIASKPENTKKNQKTSLTQNNLIGKKVLLVEDNKLNQQIANEILKSFGVNIEIADNGAAAVDLATKNDYDLILMDIQMPIMNGYVATNKIRIIPDVKKATTPIIAMTANAFDDDKRRAIKEGMNGFVSKPIDIDELLNAINDFIR